MHGVWTIDDDDIIDLGIVSVLSSRGRRHVWKPKGIDVLVEDVDSGNFYRRRNLLFVTNCEKWIDL